VTMRDFHDLNAEVSRLERLITTRAPAAPAAAAPAAPPRRESGAGGVLLLALAFLVLVGLAAFGTKGAPRG
jgi:ferric-dicitrate binding protein FerR (iron transport regulator)